MQNLANVRPIDKMVGEDDEDTALLQQSLKKAREFISSFSWCKGIRQQFFGDGVADIIGVFLFEIEPIDESVDRWLWVIVGDIPPAYLVTDNILNPSDAMRVYVGEMRAWVNAVRTKRPTDELMPVNSKPTLAAAKDLERRLNFIEKEIIR